MTIETFPSSSPSRPPAPWRAAGLLLLRELAVQSAIAVVAVLLILVIGSGWSRTASLSSAAPPPAHAASGTALASP